MRALGYCRVSSLEQATGTSLRPRGRPRRAFRREEILP